MMITSGVPTDKEQFVSSPPRFQLEPPGESPFEATPPTSVVNTKGSFDVNWVENPVELGASRAEQILDDILARSRADVERFSSDAQVHANYGVALMNRGRLDDAANEFAIALKLSPNHFMSWASLARIRALQGHFDEAARTYEQLSRVYPNELSPLVNLSYILFRTNRLSEATRILDNAIELDANAVFPRYLMAVSLLGLTRPREAIRHLRIAARNDVRSPHLYQALGVAYLIAGDKKAAVRSFKTALTLAPDSKESVRALSNVLLETGKITELIELLSAYLERQPGDVTAREALSEAHSRNKQYPLARLQLTTALRYVTGETESDIKLRAKLLNNIGVCFFRLKDIDKAAHWFERSIAVDPRFDAIPYLNRAKVHVRKRQFNNAWNILKSCHELFPQNHEIPQVQAFVLAEQDRNDEAIELLRKEVATGQAIEGTYGDLGLYLTESTHRVTEACKVLSEGLERYPSAPLLVNNLAYALLMNGDPVKARTVLTSLQLDKVRPLKLMDRVALTATWGLLYLWEGDLLEGRRHYEMAEKMSYESENTDLPEIVRQKMHLEIAKFFIRAHDLAAAKKEIEGGLSIKNGRAAYAQELNSLSEQTNS